MRAYIITEKEKGVLFKELELEKFQTPTQMELVIGGEMSPEEAARLQRVTESIHRRFLYVVSRALED